MIARDNLSTIHSHIVIKRHLMFIFVKRTY
ncbi:hypothetical protein X956_04515 [Trueperella pyogenes TP8]|nr:hypothetical protein X956_04515 [Trueperella pyogenes TP8]